MTPSRSRMLFLLAAVVFVSGGSLPAVFATSTGADNKAIHSVSGTPAKNPDSKAPPKENPINVIARDLKHGEMQDDAATKIYDFMWKDYVGAAFKNAPDNQGRLRAAVKEWVAKESQGDAPRRELAQLYFVLADEAGVRTKALSTAMEPWTGKPAAAKDNPGTFAQGQLSGTDFAPWVLGFLTDAKQHAHKQLTDPRTLPEVKKSVGQNEEKPVVPAEIPKPATGDPVPSPAYAKLPNWEYLFAQGGEAGVVGPLNSQLGKNDPDAFSRDISLKIVSKKDENGKISNELRVYDYTDRKEGQEDIFYRNFPLKPGITPPFQLDDRVAGVAKRKYQLTIKEDGEIIFCMPKNCEPPSEKNFGGAGQIRTTVSKLHGMRLEQARQVGVPKTINGQDFLVLDQGGQFGGKLFFPASIRSDPKIDTPAMVAEVSERKDKKNVINTEGKIDIGMVGDKRYHLKYVKEPPPPGFDVFPGAGDPPKPKPQPVPPPSTTPPGTNPTTPTDPPAGTQPPGDGRNDPNTGYGKACVPTEDEMKKEKLKHYKQGDWSFFVQPIKEKGTSSQLCFNDSQRIFVQGLFVEEGIREETVNGHNNFVLDVVSGNPFVHPDSLQKGQVPESSIPGGGERTPYPTRDIFYINPDKLKAEYIKKVIELNDGNYPTPDKLARVQVRYNVSRKKAMALMVYIRGSEKDSLKAPVSIDNAVMDFGPGSSFSELYKKPANKEKILGYILAEAKKYKDKELSLIDHFTVSLYWGEEKKEIKEPVDAIHPPHVEGVDSDRLVYCPKGGMHFETASEHKAGTLHKK